LQSLDIIDNNIGLIKRSHFVARQGSEKICTSNATTPNTAISTLHLTPPPVKPSNRYSNETKKEPLSEIRRQFSNNVVIVDPANNDSCASLLVDPAFNESWSSLLSTVPPIEELLDDFSTPPSQNEAPTYPPFRLKPRGLEF
jgi:hypothetical protein